MGKDSHCQRVRVEEEKHPQSRRHISKVLVAFQTPSILTRQEIPLWWPLSSVHVRETRIMNDTSLCFVGSSDFPWTITDLVIFYDAALTRNASSQPPLMVIVVVRQALICPFASCHNVPRLQSQPLSCWSCPSWLLSISSLQAHYWGLHVRSKPWIFGILSWLDKVQLTTWSLPSAKLIATPSMLSSLK